MPKMCFYLLSCIKSNYTVVRCLLLLFFPFPLIQTFFFFFPVAGETCNRNKGRNGRLYPFLLYITVSKNSQTTRGKIKPVFFSITICQMLRYGTSFTALKSAQYTRVAFAIILLFGPRGIHVQIQLGKKLKHYYDREFIDTCLTFA